MVVVGMAGLVEGAENLEVRFDKGEGERADLCERCHTGAQESTQGWRMESL